MTLHGLHATCVSNYQEICARGFETGKGLRGTGVYFWEDEDKDIALGLAKSWYEYAKKVLRSYNECEHNDMIIIYGEWDIEENELLDIDSRPLRYQIYKMGQDYLINMTDRNNMCTLYDMFINRLEAKIGTSFKVIGATVSPMPYDYAPQYPTQVLGPPYCYIVRDTGIIKHRVFTR